MDTDNFAQHIDEIEALTSIYEHDWHTENDSGTTYSIQVAPDVKLFLTFVPEYPSHAPPKYEMIAPTITSEQKHRVAEEFQRIYKDNLGSPVLFQWIEKLKELLESWKGDAVDTEKKTEGLQESDLRKDKVPIRDLKVTHGQLITDRKSVFQGHACTVTSQEDVRCFTDNLFSNKKIAQATHNISAYRIKLPNGGTLQDCDDDGETHAGSRLLHLLQIINVMDVAVVVTRWYGGIHLGPDRFRHINNAARQVLLEAHLITP